MCKPVNKKMKVVNPVMDEPEQETIAVVWIDTDKWHFARLWLMFAKSAIQKDKAHPNVADMLEDFITQLEPVSFWPPDNQKLLDALMYAGERLCEEHEEYSVLLFAEAEKIEHGIVERTFASQLNPRMEEPTTYGWLEAEVWMLGEWEKFRFYGPFPRTDNKKWICEANLEPYAFSEFRNPTRVEGKE